MASVWLYRPSECFRLLNDHSDLESGYVLLKREIRIACYEHIEFRRSSLQEHAIGDSSPMHLIYGSTIVLGQDATKAPVKAFVNEYSHVRIKQFPAS